MATLRDDIRHAHWSRVPYHHLEIGVSLFNAEQSAAEDVYFEVLVPEQVIFDFSGSQWQPSHKHSVNGEIYVVWSTLGKGLRAAMIPTKGRWQERLTVNIKPYITSIKVMWRVFQYGDPVDGYGEKEIALKSAIPPF
jgi:hypothetical protein